VTTLHAACFLTGNADSASNSQPPPINLPCSCTLNGPDDLVQLQGKLQLFPVQAQALAYLTKSDNQIFICNAITMSQLQANKGNAASLLTLPKAFVNTIRICEKIIRSSLCFSRMTFYTVRKAS